MEVYPASSVLPWEWIPLPHAPAVMTTFVCPSCDSEQPNSLKYIYRFADECSLGQLGRERRCEVHAQGDYIKCMPCRALEARTRIVLRRNGLSEPWGGVGKEGKAKFMRDAADKFGADLRVHMDLVITESETDVHSVSFTCSGGFFDEQDITDKYKDKPDQLKAIFENAQVVTCPVRKVKLWQDPQYVLAQKTENVKRREEKREATQESVVKPAKKAKTAQEPKAKLPKEEGTLRPPDIARLQKIQEKLMSTMTSWEECFHNLRGSPANGPSVEEHVPKFAVAKAEVQSAAIGATMAQLDLAVTSKKGNAKELITAANAALKASKPCFENIESFIEAARDHVGEEEAAPAE